ncbi:MAG: hypothetical protein DRO67_00395 [Candidatus Asgardarchaeum californiense]|nr:MAG: hypothetical protein DRO67_00395 [Candidatus Asgardarchaeum californiense]
MIREFKNPEYVQITVVLRDGYVYERKDIPEAPLGDGEKYVSFWDDDHIKIIPLDLVDHIKLHENSV